MPNDQIRVCPDFKIHPLNDKTIKIWYKNIGVLLSTMARADGVLSVAFASNNVLASGSDDKTVRLWDTITGKLLRSHVGHGDRVWQEAFDSNDLLAGCSKDKTVKLWGT